MSMLCCHFSCPNCTYCLPDLLSMSCLASGGGGGGGSPHHHHHHQLSQHRYASQQRQSLASFKPFMSPAAFNTNSGGSVFGGNERIGGRHYSTNCGQSSTLFISEIGPNGQGGFRPGGVRGDGGSTNFIGGSIGGSCSATNSPGFSAFPQSLMNRSMGSGGASRMPTVMSMQKTRKPYFMPYISEGAMLRGLKNGDLLKGVLRINRYNYEESYVEVISSGGGHRNNNNNSISGFNNPNDSCISSAGDVTLDNSGAATPRTPRSQLAASVGGLPSRKLMILNVHDRNRALHGDEVVIRIKDRSEWMVREVLYQSWRSGELNALFDENGQPISIPPLKPPTSAQRPVIGSPIVDRLKFLPTAFHKRVLLFDDIGDGAAIPVPADRRYESNTLLQLGAASAEATLEPSEEVKKLAKTLSIARDFTIKKPWEPTTTAVPAAVNSFQPMTRYHVTGHGSNRSTYRLLSDMPDEDWGIPDICLQKTAEVVYIFKAKNSREAVGQLKVMADGNRNWALFSPTDSRMPRMMVPADQLPEGFFERAAEYAKLTFVAQIVEWAATAQFSRGRLIRQLSTTPTGGSPANRSGSSDDTPAVPPPTPKNAFIVADGKVAAPEKLEPFVENEPSPFSSSSISPIAADGQR